MAKKTAVFGIGLFSCGSTTALSRLAHDENGAYLDFKATMLGVEAKFKGWPKIKEADEILVDYLTKEMVNLSEKSRFHSADDLVDQLIMKMLRSWIYRERNKDLIIIDGAPENIRQALDLLEYIDESTHFTPCSIWFSTSVEICVAREKLNGRNKERDEIERIERLKTFQNKTVPILPLLRTESMIFELDNRFLHPDDTYCNIRQFLGLPHMLGLPINQAM